MTIETRARYLRETRPEVIDRPIGGAGPAIWLVMIVAALLVIAAYFLITAPIAAGQLASGEYIAAWQPWPAALDQRIERHEARRVCPGCDAAMVEVTKWQN